MKRRVPRPSPVLALAGALLTACASSGESASEEVVRLIRTERYDEAVRVAEAHAEAEPDDDRARELHRKATVVWHLDRGRQAVFDRRLEDALDELNLALELDPDNTVVVDWVRKTRDELTRRWLDRGLELLQAGEFDRAIEAYELAEYYTPRHPEAVFGATRVLFLINYRQGLGEEYYNEGVRAMHRHYLTQARSKFWSAEKYSEDDGAAHERRRRVEDALAEERLFVARGLEEEGNFGAAQVEYRIILKLDPGNEKALEGLERTSSEVEAERLLEEAEKLILQSRFEEALAKLDEGQALTEQQEDHFSRLRADIEVAHWESLYRLALDQEQDFRYVEAVATYGRLLDEAEFYEDAAERKATLEDYVDRAAELYAELEDAESAEEELAVLREIELFWPEYRDVQDRLAELEDEVE